MYLQLILVSVQLKTGVSNSLKLKQLVTGYFLKIATSKKPCMYVLDR
jgi:hypothetical protein